MPAVDQRTEIIRFSPSESCRFAYVSGMTRPPVLTQAQRTRLRRLEPALRDAVRRGDYEAAKQITADIQSLLRPTGHETRLMQAKNWLFESAMEAGHLEVAMAGFRGIRQKMSSNTRVYLEATALLAICHLRRKEVGAAEPLIAEVLKNENVISSLSRRRQFRIRVVQRFEEEAVLAALTGGVHERLDIDRVQAEAGAAVQSQTEDEILANIGSQVPPEVIALLLHVHDFASRQLTVTEVELLPPPRTITEKVSLGRTILNAVNRVVWRSLCDPESEVYKMWCTQGMIALIDKKFLTVAVVAALSGMRIGAFALAAYLTAIILKMGLEVFCELAKPESVMIERNQTG